VLHLTAAWWEIPLRTAIVYAIVLIGVRAAGKREIGQMTSFDLVLLLLLSNAVQNAMTGPDTSLAGGLEAAITLFLVNAGLVYVAFRNPSVQRGLTGRATLLINNGHVIRENLRAELVTEDELMAALREHGILSPSDVALAVLEVDGSISVVRREDLQSEPARPASSGETPEGGRTPKPARHPIRFLHARR
jgi:uncharacterized membrane protein YcaP (DUF421 family)